MKKVVERFLMKIFQKLGIQTASPSKESVVKNWRDTPRKRKNKNIYIYIYILILFHFLL